MKNKIKIQLSLLNASLLILLINAALAYSQCKIESVSNNLKYLSSDSLAGREPGTKGGTEAAKFIADYFQSIGLKEFGEPDGNPYHKNFKFAVNISADEKSTVIIHNNSKVTDKDAAVSLILDKDKSDWRILPLSGSIKAANLETVFGGFGVTAAELSYDDYKNIDVSDKAVIILADSSLNGSENYNFLSDYSAIYYKIHNAKNHNAKMLIVVKRNNVNADEMYPDFYDRFASSEIPVIQMSRSMVKLAFPQLFNLDSIESTINSSKNANSFALSTKIDADINQITEYREVPNIVGYVPGTDPKFKDEYIVVGAHFDHLGMGKFNSLYTGKTPMVHNGADDNASGTTAVMDLARYFSAKPAARPIIFATFNCEESGLIGSYNFVKNPPVPINNIVTMINFDMVGRMTDNKLNIMGMGTSDANAKVIDEVFSKSDIQVSKMQDGFAPSDQSSFFAAKIPVLMFFTGVHSDYHTPYDDFEKINFKGMEKVINYSEKVIRNIANLPDKPDFVDKPVLADKEQKPAAMGRSGAWFGIVPNFAEDPDGMPISGTSDGSPAQEIGLQNGDVITEFAGKKMKNLYDLTYTLKELKPGDVIKVKYIRDKKTYEVDCTLRKRR